MPASHQCTRCGSQPQMFPRTICLGCYETQRALYTQHYTERPRLASGPNTIACCGREHPITQIPYTTLCCGRVWFVKQ